MTCRTSLSYSSLLGVRPRRGSDSDTRRLVLLPLRAGKRISHCACVCFLEFNARHGRRSVAKCLLLGHLRFCLEALLPCFCDEHFFARSPVPKCPKPGSSVIGRSSISFQRDCRRQPRAHFTLRTLRGCCKQEEKLCSGQAAAGDMSLRSTWDDSSTESGHAAIPVLHATSHLKRERVLHRAGRLRHFPSTSRRTEGQRERKTSCLCLPPCGLPKPAACHKLLCTCVEFSETTGKDWQPRCCIL